MYKEEKVPHQPGLLLRVIRIRYDSHTRLSRIPGSDLFTHRFMIIMKKNA